MTDIIDTTDSCLRYTILDPTGNITALVETSVPVEKQPGIAAEIMKCHPKVEQVGEKRMIKNFSFEYFFIIE